MNASYTLKENLHQFLADHKDTLVGIYQGAKCYPYVWISKYGSRYLYLLVIYTLHIPISKCVVQSTAYVDRLYFKGSLPRRGNDHHTMWHFGFSAGLRSLVCQNVSLCTPTWTELLLLIFF